MAYVAQGVNEDIKLNSKLAHLVSDDFNIGHSDTGKNGIALNEDVCKIVAGKTDMAKLTPFCTENWWVARP